MIAAALVPLALERGTPFVDVTAFEGYDYSGATFTMEVRDYPDKPGDPLIALSNAGPTAQGISCTVEVVDAIPVSSVRIQINETTIEALEKTSPRGGDRVFAYALDVAGGGHVKTRRMKGPLIVQASANG